MALIDEGIHEMDSTPLVPKSLKTRKSIRIVPESPGGPARPSTSASSKSRRLTLVQQATEWPSVRESSALSALDPTTSTIAPPSFSEPSQASPSTGRSSTASSSVPSNSTAPSSAPSSKSHRRKIVQKTTEELPQKKGSAGQKVKMRPSLL